jgi:hypothetical protein
MDVECFSRQTQGITAFVSGTGGGAAVANPDISSAVRYMVPRARTKPLGHWKPYIS